MGSFKVVSPVCIIILKLCLQHILPLEWHVKRGTIVFKVTERPKIYVYRSNLAIEVQPLIKVFNTPVNNTPGNKLGPKLPSLLRTICRIAEYFYANFPGIRS